MSKPIELTVDQQDAVDSLECDCIVSAGAGSGKTRVLVERYLKILEKHQYDPELLDQVIAITFTEKAATEMKERIRHSIKERIRLAKEAGKEDEALGWYRLSTEMERARISTIHSFCQRILRRYPIEAGVDPDFVALDEFEARWLLQQAVEQSISAFLVDGEIEQPFFENWLVPLGVKEGRDQLMSVVSQLFTLGWSVEKLKQKTTADLQQFEKNWETNVEEWKTIFFQALDHLLNISKSKSAKKLLERWPNLRESWEQIHQLPLLYELIQEVKAFLGGAFGKGDEEKQARERSKVALEHLSRLIASQIDLPNEKRLLELLCERISHILDLYQQFKDERSAIDFDEMQWRVIQLLKQHPAIRLELQQRIRYMMVDEYQDTNDVQKQLIDLLIQDEEKGYTPGKLFVVGDPKQSIYRFRGAEVSLFDRTRKEIEERKGKEVVLKSNFRSHPELISFYNHFFGQLMSKEESSPNYYQIVEAREKEEETQPEAVVEYLAVPTDRKELPKGLEPRELEARMIARRISELNHHGIPYRNMAILFRSMTYIKTYERELARFHIPFHVVKGSGFYDRQEIKDVLHFLRILIEPENKLAWVGVLRSPFCGISDETLLRLSMQNAWQHPVHQWEQIIGITGEEQRKLRQFARLLMRIEEWIGTRSVSQMIECLLEESGYLHLCWSTPVGKQAMANLKKLCQLASSLQGLEAYSIPHFLERIELFIQDEQKETEASIEADHSDSIKLMTIHRSKGLEFPVVFVPDISSTPPASFGGSVYIDPDRGLVTVLRDANGERKKGWRWHLAEERDQQLEREESIRVLYVAATRAEQLLVFSGGQEGLNLKNNETVETAQKWSKWLDGILDFQKIDLEKRQWLFSDQCLPIRVYHEYATEDRNTTMLETPLDVYIQGDLQKEQSILTVEQLQLLQPRGFTEYDSIEISVTDWKELVNCPRRYFYEKVLGLPVISFETSKKGDRGDTPVLAAKQKGSIVHKVIEHLSQPANQGRDWTQVCEQVWSEFDIVKEKRQQALEEIRPYIEHFVTSPIYQEQNQSQKRYTEMPFTVCLGGLKVIGVIDYLYQTPEGTWEIVDYKTDSICSEEVEITANEYLPQLQLYALAIKERWGISPQKVSLFFLNPNHVHSVLVTEEWLQQAEEQIKQSVEWLRKVNPSQPFSAHPGKRCNYCDYRFLCEQAEW